MSEEALFSHETGIHFILNFGIFNCFCFIWKLWIRWGRYQLGLQLLKLPTASSKHAGGVILSLLWHFTAPSFQILLNLHWKMWKTVVQECKLLKSLSQPRGLALKIKAQRLFPLDKFTGVFFRLPTSQRIKGLWCSLSCFLYLQSQKSGVQQLPSLPASRQHSDYCVLSHFLCTTSSRPGKNAALQY